MPSIDRRDFLSTFAASVAAGPALLGQDRTADLPGPSPYPPDTLFLTWQRDPTTTMTIQWVGSDWETPDPTIFLAPFVPAGAGALAGTAGTAAGGPWRAVRTTARPYPMTNLTVYRAEATGLTPGTEYKFRIGKAARVHRFRTMPAKQTDAVHFVSGGDCGVNAHAINNNILAAKQDPWFVLIGGDLGYDNGRSPATMLAFLRNYSRHVVDSHGRLIPMVTCIGNHEVNGGYGKTRDKAPFFLALFDGLFAETTYAALDFGDYLTLVLLDTGHIAPIGGEQADWLEKTLAARRDRPHLIAVNHVPAYPSFRAPPSPDGKAGTGAENRKFWVPLFEKYNVDVVLEHHDHTFKRTHPLRGGLKDRTGIVYLGDGSWGQLRVPKSPESRPYLAAVGGTYHMSLHRLEEEQRFHMALEETGKVVDVCSTAKKARYRLPG